jgi:hypothetical protein
MNRNRICTFEIASANQVQISKRMRYQAACTNMDMEGPGWNTPAVRKPQLVLILYYYAKVVYYYYLLLLNRGPPLWSKLLARDPEVRV